MKALFSLLFALVASGALAAEPEPPPLCPLAVAAAGDALAFAIHEDPETARFAEGIPWTRDRFERVARSLEPDYGKREPGDPVIFRGFYDAYARATGVTVEIDLRKELGTYLEEKGLAVSDLEFLDAGAQGALFTHPKLGNQLIKVTTTALQQGRFHNSAYPSLRLGGSMEHQVVQFPQAYAALELWRAYPAAEPLITTHQQALVRAYRGQCKQGMHRAQQIMLPGLMAAQAKLPYVDFARVHFIGSGFFVREYYPDSAVGSAGAAWDWLRADGTPPEQVETAILETAKTHPVLAELASALIVNVPSYFISRTLYEATKATHPRLLVIYDID